MLDTSVTGMSTDGTSPGISSLPLGEQPGEIRRQIMAQQRAAEELFVPSPIIERLLWQVCGAWETVIEEVRFFHYVLDEDPPTEPPFPTPDGGRVAKDMRGFARRLNLRLPSNTIWTDECKRAKAMRDDLGHMLHFRSTSGETPDQVVTVLRVPYKESDEMSVSTAHVGRWDHERKTMTITGSGGWARHNRKTVTITERDARDVLAGLKYVKDSIFALRKFGMEFAIWPDGKSIDDVLRIMPWWLEEWGQPGEPGWSVPTMSQLRVRPQPEFIESLPPSQRPQF